MLHLLDFRQLGLKVPHLALEVLSLNVDITYVDHFNSPQSDLFQLLVHDAARHLLHCDFRQHVPNVALPLHYLVVVINHGRDHLVSLLREL